MYVREHPDRVKRPEADDAPTEKTAPKIAAFAEVKPTRIGPGLTRPFEPATADTQPAAREAEPAKPPRPLGEERATPKAASGKSMARIPLTGGAGRPGPDQPDGNADEEEGDKPT